MFYIDIYKNWEFSRLVHSMQRSLKTTEKELNTLVGMTLTNKFASHFQQ